MFTGIVEGTARVKMVSRRGTAARLEIDSLEAASDVKIGDSIAINGVCLTVTGKKNSVLFFDAVGNTLKKTGIKRLKPSDEVNLENALKIGDSVSGHMVSGHVDGERSVRGNKNTSRGRAFDVGILPGDEKYLVVGGSVAVDGVSLTVGAILRGFFRIFLIPHTFSNTTLKKKKTGDWVNVEFDMLAKYALKNKNCGRPDKGI